MSDAWFGPGKKGLPPRGRQQANPQVNLHRLAKEAPAPAEEFTCFGCGRAAPVHVWIDHQLWNEIKNPYARSGQGGVLCLYCMSDILEKKGYKDGSVGISISNGPFCKMEWAAITAPYEARIAELEAQLAASATDDAGGA